MDFGGSILKREEEGTTSPPPASPLRRRSSNARLSHERSTSPSSLSRGKWASAARFETEVVTPANRFTFRVEGAEAGSSGGAKGSEAKGSKAGKSGETSDESPGPKLVELHQFLIEGGRPSRPGRSEPPKPSEPSEPGPSEAKIESRVSCDTSFKLLFEDFMSRGSSLVPACPSGASKLICAESINPTGTGTENGAFFLAGVDSEGRVSLNPSGISTLSSFEGPLEVISIVGPSRSGKSFLLNRLAGRRGFAVGGTTQACTRGVWGLLEGGRLFLDSEGLSAPGGVGQADLFLLLFVVMSSSVVVYNSLGLVDESAMELFEAAGLLAASLRGSPRAATEFPSLIWLLRDFTLQLPSDSADTYLEKSLSGRTQTKAALSSLFSRITCRTLVRPMYDDRGLSALSDPRDERLRSDFIRQADELAALVRRGVGRVAGRPPTGPLIVLKLEEVAKALNSRRLPCMENLNNKAETFLLNAELGRAEARLAKEIEILAKKLPVEPVEIERKFREVFLDSAERAARELGELGPFRREFEARAALPLAELTQKNQAAVDEFNRRLAEELLGDSRRDLPAMLAAVAAFRRRAADPAGPILAEKIVPEMLKRLDEEHGKTRGEAEKKCRQLEDENSELKSKVDQLTQLTRTIQLQQRQFERENTPMNPPSPQLDPLKWEALRTELEAHVAELSAAQKRAVLNLKVKEKAKQETKNEMIALVASTRELLEHLRTLAERSQKTPEAASSIYEDLRADLKELRSENKKLESLRSEQALQLAKRESEIKMLQEKIRADEKLRHGQMEFSSMLCNISDKVVHMLGKVEKKI